jgi:hypothetical protein
VNNLHILTIVKKVEREKEREREREKKRERGCSI